MIRVGRLAISQWPRFKLNSVTRRSKNSELPPFDHKDFVHSDRFTWDKYHTIGPELIVLSQK